MTSTTIPVVTVGLDALDILTNDRASIKGLLTDLVDATESKRRKDILSALHRIAGEQRESEELYRETGVAFPHLREKATPEQSEALTEAVRAFRSALRYEPTVV